MMEKMACALTDRSKVMPGGRSHWGGSGSAEGAGATAGKSTAGVAAGTDVQAAQRTQLRTASIAVAFLVAAVAGRVLFAGVPNVQPVTALCIVAGMVCGRRWGLAMGMSAALLSNMVLGQGIWTLFQMAGWGAVGWTAGALFAHPRSGAFGRWMVVCAFGFVASLAFGTLMDSQVVLLVGGAMPMQTILGIYAAGLPFNLAHAIGTVAFLIPLGALIRCRSKIVAK